MAVNEFSGFLKYKDADGNINLLMPITNVDSVAGMDEIQEELATTVKTTEQTLTDAEKTQARTNIGAASSWNDLADRPIYATTTQLANFSNTNAVSIEEQTTYKPLTYIYDITDTGIIEGNTYIVNFDGVDYECVAKRNSDVVNMCNDAICLGNHSIYPYFSSTDGLIATEDTGEPFLICYWDPWDSTDLTRVYFKDAVTVFNISVNFEMPKLNAEYLPDNLATTEYVDNAIAAIPTPDVSGQIDTHNISETAHSDIRILIEGLTTRLNALADSDDTTLDQMSEIIAYIKANKSLIDSITTNKVNVSDIIDNLTTNVSNKPLSAAQGVALKGLIDELDSDKVDYSTMRTQLEETIEACSISTLHFGFNNSVNFDTMEAVYETGDFSSILNGLYTSSNYKVHVHMAVIINEQPYTIEAEGKLTLHEELNRFDFVVNTIDPSRCVLVQVFTDRVAAIPFCIATPETVAVQITEATSEMSAKIDELDSDKLDTSELTNAINTALSQAKESGEFNGADGNDGKDGTSVTVTSVSESTTDGGDNVVTFSDGNTITIKNGSKGSTGETGKTAYQYAKDGGYTGTEAEFNAKLATEYLPLAGGTMSGPLVLTGGDAASGVGNMQLDTNGQITAKGTTSTLFGRNSATTLLVGHSSHSLSLRGSATRPTYNGANMAMMSDLGRSTAVNANDTNYTTLMARGTSLNSAETTPAVNGAIAWTYE